MDPRFSAGVWSCVSFVALDLLPLPRLAGVTSDRYLLFGANTPLTSKVNAWFGKQLERYTQYPLAHGLMRQDFVHQQGGTVNHSARTATGTESASLATERHGPLTMAGLAPDP